MVPFVCVAVVDPHGRVLLQERDEHARVAPETWSLPGGTVEAGEATAQAAARALAEETGLSIEPDDLVSLGRFQVDLEGPADHEVLAVRGDLGPEDVQRREGRRVVFVDRAAIGSLLLAEATAQVLPVLDAWIEETRRPPRLAGVILVDGRGRLLLQQRDEHPALDPLKWGLVGGHLDDDEDFETGAHRELAEETEVELPPGSLTLFKDYPVHGGRMQVFVGGCDLGDDDIVCHEGLQIVFVDAEEALTLDLGTSAAVVVPELLASRTYEDLRRAAGSSA